MTTRIPRLLARWALISASIAALLFLSAGTVRITSIRNYLAAFSVLLLVTMLAVEPGLAHERAIPGESGPDDPLRLTSRLLFLLTLIVAASSVGHLGASFNATAPIRYGALAVFALSGAFQSWAMIVNPFFSPVVRIQNERGHHVIERGPYQFLRHPGYFAMSISVPMSALAIGSWIGLAPGVAFSAVVIRRAQIEDQFLRSKLAGYQKYASRVRTSPFMRLSQNSGEHAEQNPTETTGCI
jgi:protein-S-isoprenylcysteine O-methyltransferase Ste14